MLFFCRFIRPPSQHRSHALLQRIEIFDDFSFFFRFWKSSYIFRFL